MLRCAIGLRVVCIVASLVLSTASAGAADSKSIEQAAHDAYVTAINSNDVNTLLADLTDDIVYQSPGEPEIVGKVAVRKWLTEYFGATRTHWEKTSIGFVVNGDWAFERYTYKSTDTGRKTGAVTTDTGKVSTSSAAAATVAGAWQSMAGARIGRRVDSRALKSGNAHPAVLTPTRSWPGACRRRHRRRVICR